MTVTVGIPRGLLYYEYGPAMHIFLKSCGAEVIVSPATNREILETGLALCVDDACLPVKAFFGHAAALAGKVDVLFVPRFVSIERRAYICPKLMGLPDMIRSRLKGVPPVIDLPVNMYRGMGSYLLHMARSESARILGISPSRLVRACASAFLTQGRENRRRANNVVRGACMAVGGRTLDTHRSIYEAELTIGVLGHRYNLDDPYLSLNLISRLGRMGVTTVTAEDYTYGELRRWERRGRARKRMFWTTGRKLMGAARRWRNTGEVDGIICLTSFGCGPESFIVEVIAGEATLNVNMPLMVLNVDEHSGEAGMATRLEAFVDTVRMRRPKQ